MSLVSSIAIFVSALVNLAIGSYVFIKRKHQLSNQAFALFTLGTFLWGTGFVLLSYTSNMVFDSVTLFGVVIGVLGLVIFSEDIARGKKQDITTREIIKLLPLIILMLGIPDHWYIANVVIENGQVHPINTNLFPAFAVVVAGYIILSFYNIVLASRNKNYQTQSKGLVLLLSLGIFLVLSLIFNLMLPMLGVVWGNSIGFITLTVLVFGGAYTLLFEHLFDVRFIFQKVFIYTSLLLGTIGVYSLIIFIVQTFFLWQEKSIFIVTGILSTFLVSLSVPFVDRKLRECTDTWLYHRVYHHDAELLLVMKNLGSKLNLEDIIQGIQNEIQRIFQSENVHTIIADSRCSSATETIITDVKKYTLWMPLKVENAFVGTLVIEKKKSGASYSQHDQNFIETLAHYLASKLWLAVRLRTIDHAHRELSISAEKSDQENQILRKQQDIIITDLAHNLQTPLTILRSQLENLSHINITKEHLLHKEARELELQVEKISQFITRLLQAGRQTTHEYHFQKMSLSTELSAIAEYLETIAHASDINFQYKGQENIFAVIDTSALEEMITNVVSNAFKYRREGTPHEVVMSLEIHDDHFAKITITDNGLGIPKSDLPFLFERWYRANREQYSGTGLGLAMVKNIIEAHKGRIRIESELGEGTQVFLYIPLNVQ